MIHLRKCGKARTRGSVASNRHHSEGITNGDNTNLLFIGYGAKEIRHGALQELGLQRVAGVVGHEELGPAQDIGVRRVFGEEEAVQHASDGTGRRELCVLIG